MKIYFAGSIKGGREDVSIYQSIIFSLKKYGEILTEHIGDEKYVTIERGDTEGAKKIYNQALERIKESEILVAEVSQPSLGVGYEIAYAESINKKILCLYREGAVHDISCMISGNKNIDVRIYKSVDELPRILEEFFKNYTKQ